MANRVLVVHVKYGGRRDRQTTVRTTYDMSNGDVQIKHLSPKVHCNGAADLGRRAHHLALTQIDAEA
eukprot:1321949-Pleurochrysis_carterae.AAC.1